jgi:hypothetical protein
VKKEPVQWEITSSSENEQVQQENIQVSEKETSSVQKNQFTIWAASRQNQHNGSATSMDPDQPAHPRSLIRIHAVRLQTL